MVNGVSQSYSSWIQSLNSRGIKTTSLGASEANFADYTNALSESLKQEILASFDTQADYDLQARLASLFGSRSVMQSGDIVSAARNAGIQVKVQYVPTTYIVDNKKGGSYMNNKNAIQGSIAVYTFSDGKGGEIKIADANGNGALESEEIFMNELLSGVTSDLSPSGAGGTTGANGAAAMGGAGAVDDGNAALIAQLEAQLEADMQKLDELIAQGERDQQKYEAKSEIEKNYPDIKGDKLGSTVDQVMSVLEDSNMTVHEAVVAVLGEPAKEEGGTANGADNTSNPTSQYAVESVSVAGVKYVNPESVTGEEEPEVEEEEPEVEEPKESDDKDKDKEDDEK